MAIHTYTPETLATILTKEAGNVLEKAIKKEMMRGAEVIVNTAAKEMAQSLVALIESYNSPAFDKVEVTLRLNNKNIPFTNE